MTPFLLCLLIVFTLSSGFFSLSQISLFSLSSGDIKQAKLSKDPRKKQIASLLSRPRDLLVTLLFCDIGTNILIQNTSANLFGQFSTWGLKVGVPLLITLLLGEIFPKTIALSFNTTLAPKVAPIVTFLQKMLRPVSWLLTSVTSIISHFFFFFLKKSEKTSAQELSHTLQSSEATGILNQQEVKLVRGYLNLTETTVKERMHPREEIIAYDIETPFSELISLFQEKHRSRIPVYQNDLQHILGIISVNALVYGYIKKKDDLKAHLKKPFFVPETITARTLMKQFLEHQEELGIVIDEYGSVSGLITQEDLYEVVVGEIADLDDQKPLYTWVGEKMLIASGKFELAEFEKLFGKELPTHNHMVTIGGWLTEQMGDLPKSGAQFSWEGFIFQILAADHKRIRRVYIRKVKP